MIKVSLYSHHDFEFLVALLQIDNEDICIIDREAGIDNMKIHFFFDGGGPNIKDALSLNELERAIYEAKEKLNY